MDQTTHALEQLLYDKHFDESNFHIIEEILVKQPAYVDYFVQKIDREPERFWQLYLIILDIVPLESCLNYALEVEDWKGSDFVDYSWFDPKTGLKPLTMNEYKVWLSRQVKSLK